MVQVLFALGPTALKPGVHAGGDSLASVTQCICTHCRPHAHPMDKDYVRWLSALEKEELLT